jgi:phosphoglycerate-specific signal transduction histidine kinase
MHPGQVVQGTVFIQAQTKNNKMTQQQAVKKMFLKINTLIINAETSQHEEKLKALRTLRQINEELCDHVVEYMKKNDRNIPQTQRQSY